MPAKKTTKTKKPVKKPSKKVAPKKNTKKTTKTKKPVKKSVKKAPAKPASKKAPSETKKKPLSLSLIRGMKDVLPQQDKFWMSIYRSAEDIARAYGFKYMETPIVEQSSLFVKSIGKGTDVVDKEMYTFEDKEGSKSCLRPEFTAGVARAYIMHGLQTIPQPVKVWSWGPLFRHDRPQAGRYREFHQFNCEILGEHSPVVDAELISIAYHTITDLGIDVTVKINSIGTREEREQYIVELVGYLRSKRSYLSEQSKKRITKNPLRVLDSKEPEDQAIIEEAPQIIDWLSAQSKNFFMSVLEYLDELQIPYVLAPNLVRGLDYYTDIVFEIVEEGVEETSQGSLVGGGRYDGLIEKLGGQPTPAAGFGMGVERVMSILQKRAKERRNKLISSGETEDKEEKVGGIFFAQLGEQANRRALALIEMLRKEGIIVHHNLAKSSLKAQMEIANKFGVTHTLILGQKEVQDESILLRDMDSGNQEVIDQNKLKQTVKKLLNK